MIKVMVVDDHELVRIGISRILNDAPGIRVIAEAASGEEAIDIVRRRQPDVVLMDVNMPGIGGFEATRKLLHLFPALKVIVVTIHVEDPFPTRLIKAGAMGYLTKGCAVDEIISAIKAVHAGQRYLGAEVAQQVALKMMPGGGASPLDSLSPRELQVLLMMVQGQRIQDISDRLCLSAKTISTYRHRVYEKLGVSGDVELTRFAIRHGLVNEALEPI